MMVIYIIVATWIFLLLTNAEVNYCSKDRLDHCQSTPLIDPSLNHLDQSDPKLIQIIKEKYLIPPTNEEYNFTVPLEDLNYAGQYRQSLTVDAKIFKSNFKKGFFIEAGAANGEQISNTLHFEIRRDWTGLLIEPNPEMFQELIKKKRKAWLFGHCLSTKTTPEIVNFDLAGLLGGIEYRNIRPGGNFEHPYFDAVNRHTIQLQCFPLYSVLMALGNPTVHFFSLDIEGAELQVLQTIPFDKVDIKVFDIEVKHVGQVFPGSLEELHNVLLKHDYEYYSKISIDDIFVKKNFKVKKNKIKVK